MPAFNLANNRQRAAHAQLMCGEDTVSDAAKGCRLNAGTTV
jgi:hypothetical protein